MDCNLETRCIESTDVSDLVMQDYVSLKLSLKRKQRAKCKHKVPLPLSMVVYEPEVFAGDLPPAEPASPSVSPVTVTTASVILQSVDTAVVDQFKSMIASFAKSLEARFSSFDCRFSQVMTSSASVTQPSDVSCQDVNSNHSLSAPSPVAMRTEHPPDRGPSALYSDNLGTTLGGLAVVSASIYATSLPCMSFADLLAAFQFFEASGRVPDSFLDTLRSYVIVAPDFDVAISGSSLADAIRAYHMPDPLHPVPGPSQGGDSIVPFLYRLVASLGSSPLVTSNTSALRLGGV